MHNLLWLFLITACSYKGPRVEDVVPKNAVNRLQGEVAEAQSAGLNTLVVYGDSLSDPGNLSSNSFRILLPHEIYYKGRFSNGPIWADYVGAATGWNVLNYAVSGARTHKSSFPESLMIDAFPDQIEESQDQLKELDAKRTLIAMWIGPNNYLRNGGAFETDKGKPLPALLNKGVATAIREVEEGIEDIYALGFRNFAIGTMPELGGINRSPEPGRTASDETLYESTRLHNAALRTLLSKLQERHADLKVAIYQAYEINRATYENPRDFAFTKLDKPCFEGSITGEFFHEKTFCIDPLGYKFWEYLHPNTMMHCFYASQFLDDLALAKLIKGYDKSHAIESCKAMRLKAS